MDLHLTASEKETFRQQGYIVKHDTVTLKQLETARDAVWAHLEGDRDDPSTWTGQDGTQGMGRQPAFEALIYDSPLYGMVEDLAGQGRLAPLHEFITSANFRFPTDNQWLPPTSSHMDGHNIGGGIVNNWTVGITLYLNDVEPQGGGTCVWPGTHQQMADYFKSHSRVSLSRAFYNLPVYRGEPRSTKALELLGGNEADYQEITGPAGMAIIWHSHLIHSASVNCRLDIRMATITRFRWTDWNDLKFEDPDDMWEYWSGL